MTEGRNDRRPSGILILENNGLTLTVTRLMDYHRDQSELGKAHGWGLRWIAGSKN